MASKKVYAIKSPKGNPVRCEEAWKDANGNVISDTYETKQNSEDTWATRKAQEEKCYQALKTVTKDFTRTDPVYVRIGEDGEPEIHYTMTQANGSSYFQLNLPNVSLYIHNGAVLTSVQSMFWGGNFKRIIFDTLENATGLGNFVRDCWFGEASFPNTAKITHVSNFAYSGRASNYPLFDTSTVTNFNQFFFAAQQIKTLPLYDTSKGTNFTHFIHACLKLEEVPAFDLSNGTVFGGSFVSCPKIAQFHAYGMKASFVLSGTALKHDAILEVFNNLGSDVAEGTTLTLGATKLALMSDDEKKIATDKGWTLA